MEYYHWIIGFGQVGSALYQNYKDNHSRINFWDINFKDTNLKEETIKTLAKSKKMELARVIHICFPFSDNFIKEVLKYIKMFNPQFVIIHSTVLPGTTEKIYLKCLKKQHSKIPIIIYSPVRGQHNTLKKDLKEYIKFYTIAKNDNKIINLDLSIINEIEAIFSEGQMPHYYCYKLSTTHLELIKLLDTTAYATMITYAHIQEIIMKRYNLEQNYMLWFGQEIHQKLGLRPPIYPGGLGGHCLKPNLKLLLKELDNLMSDQKLPKTPEKYCHNFLTLILLIDKWWNSKKYRSR